MTAIMELQRGEKMSGKIEKQEKVIVQNLEDAGCSKEVIDNYLKLENEGEVRAKLTLLERHRRILLDKVHEDQKKIDCLDYLIYQVKKHNRV